MPKLSDLIKKEKIEQEKKSIKVNLMEKSKIKIPTSTTYKAEAIKPTTSISNRTLNKSELLEEIYEIGKNDLERPRQQQKITIEKLRVLLEEFKLYNER